MTLNKTDSDDGRLWSVASEENRFGNRQSAFLSWLFLYQGQKAVALHLKTLLTVKEEDLYEKGYCVDNGALSALCDGAVLRGGERI